MPTKSGLLTRQEQVFLKEYANHEDRAKAEKKAGLAPRSGYAVLARPEIQRRIVQEQVARITSDALPLAVSTLVGIMRSDKAPASARVQASKVVLDRALPTGADGQPRELHEMTPDEIAAAISSLEAAAAQAARDVTPGSQTGPASPGEPSIFD